MPDTKPMRLMPYGRAYKPFSIGLTHIQPDDWLEPGNDLTRYLAEKSRLVSSSRTEVFRAVPESIPAQEELLALIVSHLKSCHTDLYQQDGNTLRPAGQTVNIEDPSEPPLLRAGMLVEDDLAILMKKDDGWFLAAGFIAFPSSWSLAEKAGKPMDVVHADVPGFEAGTRNGKLVTRIFDNLKPERPAERFNWSFKGSPALAMPVSKHAAEDPFRPVYPIGANFMRVERQTLRKLPQTGAIAFTIRIYADPLSAVLKHPERRQIAEAMIAQLEGLSPGERRYKSMRDDDVNALIAHLRNVLAPVEQRQ